MMRIHFLFLLHFRLLLLVFDLRALIVALVKHYICYPLAYTSVESARCFLKNYEVQRKSIDAFSGCSSILVFNTRNTDVIIPNAHSITTRARESRLLDFLFAEPAAGVPENGFMILLDNPKAPSATKT
ncbi:unnamed protein product [Acanthoscelides obtectus]|uniref:Uncharacterized protein n=1 Tax=Acanthoscelides obtectus TaxID=200917 RepID=A0A9P0PV57_ACAOB|nr:unnamed protein product [Acanthoscelides obtectus]CAK1651302.1 hypothetical protein AOBTE_LOCUS17167 [Acanthoscelides obtectus]